MTKHRGGRGRRPAPSGNRPAETRAGRKARDARRAVADRLLKILKDSGRGHKTRSLFSLMGKPLNYIEFCSLLDELKAAGEIGKDNMRRWVSGSSPVEMEGVLFKDRSGSGYLQPDDGAGKVLLRRRELDRLLIEDRIRVRVRERVGGGGREGKVLGLIERRLEHVVGRLAKYGREWALFPESLSFAGLVRIKGSPGPQMEQGDLVRARLLPDPDGQALPMELWVKLEECLAEKPEPLRLQDALKAEFNLPADFLATQLAEAEKWRQEDVKPAEGRLDLRDTCTYTIDPEDAKDFDDALSLRLLESGNWELGVHIADVSHFVNEGGALDKEAHRRGCTIYLPGEAIPMLPHALSSGLCSLAEGVDRYTFSVLAILSPEGDLLETRITPSLIRSRRRFTYEEVQAIIEGVPGAGEDLDDVLKESLSQLDRLWRVLKKARMKEGGLDFALPEPGFRLDDQGFPVKVEGRISREANFLVEECMLLANRCVASWLEKRNRHCVFRIHEEPGGEKLLRFRKALRWLGVDQDLSLTAVKDWQHLLNGFKGLPEEAFLNRQVLRSMMKARYDLDNPGHFGLGFSSYAHFTSPIRRYPDLLIHRLLKRQLAGEADADPGQLSQAARLSNQRELLSMEAERAANKVKQILYLKNRLGNVFPAVVSGVERFGLFVELENLLADALIALDELPDDYWELGAEGFTMKGRRSGHEFRIGDRVQVQVIRTNLEKREIDCRLAPDQS